MGTAQLLEELRQLSNAERLEFIEAATRLVRADLCAQGAPWACELIRSTGQLGADDAHVDD